MSRNGYGRGRSGGYGTGYGGFGGPRGRRGVWYGDPGMVPVFGPGLVVAERKKISFWLVLAWRVTRGTVSATIRAVRFAARHPILTAVTAATLYVYARWGWPGVEVAYGLAVLVGSWVGWLWWRLARASFYNRVTDPALGRFRWHTTYRRRWREVMAGVGLLGEWEGEERPPQVAKVASRGHADKLLVKMLPGHTRETWSDVGEALAEAFEQFRCDVTSPSRGWVELTFVRRDPLDTPVTTRHPVYAHAVHVAHAALGAPDEHISEEVVEDRVAQLLAAVPVGVTEAGETATLALRGGHVMVAGTTGSGKSGLLWALLWSLAPVIRAGYLEVAALDPKRMELTALADGPAPLGTVVKDAEVMAAFLDAQVADLDARCTALEGSTRKHAPSRRMPHRLLVVDELATITALADRKDRERIEAALGHLESRGRAAGFTVVITTVEPTKEVVRWRSLHAVRVGFRLEETSHTDMVLGDGMRDRGAVCDHINPDTPGVAYLKVDGIADPVRFRTAEITDTDLHILTHGLPAAPVAEEVEEQGSAHVRVDVIDLRAYDAPGLPAGHLDPTDDNGDGPLGDPA